MRVSVIALASMICTLCFAQTNDKNRMYSDAVMYKCYLGVEKQLWKQYVTTADWEQMSNKERERLLNYEYGYLAYAISAKDKDVKHMLQCFSEHIAAMEGQMPEATRLTYLAAAASYNISTNKITIVSNGLKAFSYSEKAVETDDKNPYALTLRGSIYFYCPPAFGGDKTLALKYLKQAEERFRQTGDTVNNWNYRSVQMVIAQCYEKTGQKDKAIDKCREILREEPNFVYIRDNYLPALLGIKPKDKTETVGDSFVNGMNIL